MKFVFQIKVKQGHTVEGYVDAWEQASVVIQQHVGCARNPSSPCDRRPNHTARHSGMGLQGSEGSGDEPPSERPRNE